MVKTKFSPVAYHFFACGQKGPPEKIFFQKSPYRLLKLFKHDFFAATALYEVENPAEGDEGPKKIVLKMYRHQHLFGVPMKWLGKCLCEHEVSILRRLNHIENIPKFLSFHKPSGFLYEYIEGNCIDGRPNLPADFFDRLQNLTNQIHNCSVIYLDMNKRGNIILGPDNLPHLIDFQISFYIDRSSFLGLPFGKFAFEALRKADLYHILKHKRSLQPGLLNEDEKTTLQSTTALVSLHRALVKPYKILRKKILRFVFSNRLIPIDDSICYHPEDDPARFLQ